jgi:hypothetical protein
VLKYGTQCSFGSVPYIRTMSRDSGCRASSTEGPSVGLPIYVLAMSNSHEPSVETLTAEVRILQVGAGQVTLSAARQLDHADPSEIEPFGRVRIEPSPDDSLIEAW